MTDKQLSGLDLRVLYRSATGDDGILGIDEEMFVASRRWLQEQSYLNHNFGLTRKGAEALKDYTPPDASPEHHKRIPGLTGFSLTGAMTMLGFLETKVTEEPLSESGRHFTDGQYSNLTSCHHGDTGEFHNSDDGEAIAILWNLWKADLLSIKFVQDEPVEIYQTPSKEMMQLIADVETPVRTEYIPPKPAAPKPNNLINLTGREEPYQPDEEYSWELLSQRLKIAVEDRSFLSSDIRAAAKYLAEAALIVRSQHKIICNEQQETTEEPTTPPQPKPAAPVSRNVEAVLKIARDKIDAAYRDINILVNQLDYLLEATGETLIVEDRMLIEAIRLQWNTEGKA